MKVRCSSPFVSKSQGLGSFPGSFPGSFLFKSISAKAEKCGRVAGPVALLLALAVCGQLSNQAWAQADRRGPAPKLSDISVAPNTPKEVMNGKATLTGRLNPSTALHLVFGLTPPNMAAEEKFLRELQDPKSPNFQKYLTPEQWNARFAPTAESEQAVLGWAKSNGLSVTRRFPNRLIVDVDGTAENVERAFGVTMNSYDLAGRSEFSNDRDPVIPSQLAGVLHSIGGLNSIQRLKTSRGGDPDSKNSVYKTGEVEAPGGHADGNKKALQAAMKASALKKSSGSKGLKDLDLKDLAPLAGEQPPVTSGFIDPTDIYSSYGYDFAALQAQGHCCNPTHNSTGTPAATSIAIATAFAFQGSDITGFQTRYNYLAFHYQPIYIDGTPSCCNDETTLDTEWAIATANSFGSYIDTSEVFVYEGVNNQLSTFTDVYNTILSRNETRVFTTSWGCGEIDCTGSSTMDTDHAIFNSMIGQGWTLMAATGDQGSAADCGNANRIQYPSSDPDIVAVGGTSLALFTDGTFSSETGWQGSTYTGACSQNNGGSTGGCSAKFAAPSYQTSPFCGSTSRSVPDISLNAGYGQNTFYNGSWSGFGGTSIASPMVAGFFAQANAYLTSLGLGDTMIGQGGPKVYYFAHNPTYASHIPFYDMTSGCNNNDITALYGLTAYCAVSGYDRVTGWGSFNALQMSWAMNAWFLGDFVAPVVNFTGPSHTQGANNWYNTDQTVSWTITDAGSGVLSSTGVAGFSKAWDFNFSDPQSEATHGTGNSFYEGPQYKNLTSGSLTLSSAGQGCHYATVDAWDNSGYTPGNQYYYYLCYDTVAPATTDALSGTWNGSVYTTPVKVTLSGTDATSGVAHTYDQLGSNPVQLYSAPFTISSTGGHALHFYSTDVAGNVEGTHTVQVVIEAPTKSVVTSGTNPSVYHQTVTFSAKVTGSFGATPTGFVTFKNAGVAMGASVALDGTGTATFPYALLTVGTHAITASYGGSGKNLTSVSAALTQTVVKANATAKVGSSLNPSHSGNKVTFTATVTGDFGGNPSGTVKFKDGSTVIGSGTLNVTTHKATFSTTTLTVGTHNITASYQGNSSYHSATSPVLKQVVNN